jgi:4-amino-4-deoxy-L-arabinose transferase-like glycosyltransferase
LSAGPAELAARFPAAGVAAQAQGVHSVRSSLAAAGAIALLLFAAALARPVLPVDETRYLAVAWEMWLQGDFLVPHLNGQLYSHKPPLLFWMIDFGWWIFGTNAWWPRLVCVAFGFASAVLAAHLASALWPSRTRVAVLAPLLLQAGGAWLLYGSLVMFDIPLAFFVLLALTGIVRAWRRGRGGWLLCAIGIGLGMLAKGPVVLLYVIPAVALAPWWMIENRPLWNRWLAGFAMAVTAGVAIALAWAIPAVIRGGAAYAQAIFWNQSAGRVVHSFAHARPFFWYLPLLPLMFAPWFFLPGIWRGLAALQRAAPDSGVRLCASSAIAILAAFSLVSGKQAHYIVPAVPLVVLLLARALDVAYDMANGPRTRQSTVPRLAAASAVLVAVGSVIAMHIPAMRGFDVTPPALDMKAVEARGAPIAHWGIYYGQYHFVGRLEHPFTIVMSAAELERWFRAHPDGRAVLYFNDQSLRAGPLEHVERYRRRYVALVDAKGAAWLLQRCCSHSDM